MDIQITFPGEQRVDANIGSLVIPTNQDGSDPTPFALFLASIGTCAGIYVVNFCRSRNLPTEGIQIVQRLHANPLTKHIEHVDLDIQVPPDFPEKYHDALIRSASLCAVKKHLEAPPAFDIHTSVVEAVPQPAMS